MGCIRNIKSTECRSKKFYNTKIIFQEISSPCYIKDAVINFEELEFESDEYLDRDMENARDVFDSIRKKFRADHKCFEHGLDHFKDLGQSTDSIFQIAMQAAFKEITGEIPTNWNPANTSHFLGGRLDTFRSVTPESIKVVEMLENDFTDSASLEMLQKSALVHRKLAKNANSGFAFDRFLQALIYENDKNYYSEFINELKNDTIYQKMLKPDIIASNSSFGLDFCLMPAKSKSQIEFQYSTEKDKISWCCTGWENNKYGDIAKELSTKVKDNLEKTSNFLMDDRNKNEKLFALN